MNKYLYETTGCVGSTYTDSSIRLGIAQAFSLFQDGFTQCLELLHCDGITYRKQYNAFWVISRAKAQFIRRPNWNEPFLLRCFPINCARVRTQMNTEICTIDNTPLIRAKQDLCVLDLDTHKPLKIPDLGFPTEGFCESTYSPSFERFSFPQEACGSLEQAIHSQFIDMSMHVNNVEYIRLALNLFSTEFLLTHEVSEIEVHYNGECKEGQYLTVKKYLGANAYYFRITEQNRNICEIKMVFQA